MAFKDLNPATRQKATPEIRDYLRKHPDCNYEELVKALSLKSLSKPWFYALRSGVRKNARGSFRESKAKENAPVSIWPQPIMTVEILESIDASGFSAGLKREYVESFQPLLRQVIPGGNALQVVVLESPPRIEVRRLIS
jgi:hypothetical protein